MLEVKGKYNSAKIFTDLVEETAIAQVTNLCNQAFTMGSQIRMMPDIHAGAGCTIGTTMTLHGAVCPNLVGVDIGCGMYVVQLGLTAEEVDLAQLDQVIHQYVPAGCNIHSHQMFAIELLAKDLQCRDHVDLERASKSLGTLGGGNHFIEVGCTPDTHEVFLIIHTGSRHLGLEVCKYYQDLAEVESDFDYTQVIQLLKNMGRQDLIQTVLEAIKAKEQGRDKSLAYLTGDYYQAYLQDMKWTQAYAKMNRHMIARTILGHMDWHNKVVMDFHTIHNYIDTDNNILRKGAVSAQAGEVLVIPMNMRDGTLLCRGKGNPDWNYSAPHGAGRIMSRAQAYAQLSVDTFQEEMKGIYTTTANKDTLDEAPMAYKPMESIIENIGDTVVVLNRIIPIYNFKGV